LRRWPRILGAVVLAVLALVGLLAGSAVTVLRTRWGGELVKRVALPRINDALAGSVQLQRFGFGGDHLSLEGVVLLDPEGRVVARVRSVDVAFSPLGLLRGRVRVSDLSVVEPALYLRRDPDGLNLARAIAPRRPGRAPSAGEREPPGPTSGGLVLDVASLRITGGSVLSP
jgi:autotransporter translocation and assembly factor TamB